MRTADLDKAIQLARDALDGVPKDDSGRPKKLSRLAQLLNDKHDAVNTGPISERLDNAKIAVDEAIEMAEEALGLIAEDSPDRQEYLRDLAIYHAARFDDRRKMYDVDRAIELMREAVNVDHPDQMRDVSRLSEYLARRFKAYDSRDDLDDDSDTTESDTQSTTSNTGEPINIDADIEEAIELAQKALSATPDKGPTRAEYLDNLANHHACRHDAIETLEDLEKAIDLGREAVGITEGLRDQAKYLNSLAGHLGRMFDATIAADDTDSASEESEHPPKTPAAMDYLNKAIKVAQVAVDLTPKADLDRAKYLDDLADHLYVRYVRTRSIDDLDKAIDLGWEVLKIIPDDYHTRPQYLYNLSENLACRWRARDNTADMEEAIRLGREALKGTAMFPRPELNRYMKFQDGLSHMLVSRFEKTHQKAGLKAALLEYLDKAPLGDKNERSQFAPQSDGSNIDKTSGVNKGAIDHNEGDMEASLNKKSRQVGYLHNQVEKSSNQEATDEMDRRIELAQATVNNMLDDDRKRLTYLNSLANALASRYKVVKDIDDLEKSIEIMRQIIDLAADNHDDKPEHLSSLASLLVQRYEAIDSSIDSVTVTSSSDYSGKESSDCEGSNDSLNTDKETMELENSGETEKGSDYSEESTDKISDLDEAIQLMRDSVKILPEDHPDRPRYLNSLASYLAARYEETEDTCYDSDYDSDALSERTEDPAESRDERESADGEERPDEEESGEEDDGADDDEANDLDEAIQLWQEAIRATGIARDDRAEYVDNLIDHLIYRYDTTDDLQEAVRLMKAEVENIPLDHPGRPTVLKRMVDHLDSIWDATKEDNLDIKIAVRQEALDIIPEGTPRRIKYLGYLARNFSSRYERTGSREDLESAIRLKREAIDALSIDDRRRAVLLIDLSISLRDRLEVTGAAVDLEEAIRLADEAVRMNTKQQTECQDILSHYILLKYRGQKRMDDLNLAIHLVGEVIRGTSDHHPKRSDFLNHLANCLDARFKRKRVSADLKIALRIQKAVVDIKTDDPVKEAYHLNNLANHLEFTYRGITGRKSDMDESLRLAQRAIDTMPEGHPALAEIIKGLASKFDYRYWISKNPNDRKRATSLYVQALNFKNGVVHDRIAAGQLALRDHITDKNWKGARSVSEAIVKLLPRLSLTSLPRRVQQGILSNLSNISGDAASVALQTKGTAAEALEILEAGRGIIASFLIDSQADISKLKESKPSLYSEYMEVRDRASLPLDEEETSEPSDTSAGVQKPSRSNVPMMISQRYKDIRRLKDLESAIRKEEGLERFLLPPTAADLIEQAKRGPIVVYNATKIRSDALLITESDGITHLPLKKLKFRQLRDNVDKFVGEQKLVVGLSSTKRERQQELQRVLKWLWDVAVRPVLKKLKLLAPVASKPLPHIWWVTNGYFGLMPIHAAGDSKKTTSDYVISSYIPTLKALQYARERDLRYLLEPNTRMLITAMPRTVGLEPLVTEKEVELVTETVKAMSSIAVSTLIEPPKSAVLDALGSCRIVHFACHGISDSENPSGGSLFLGESTNEAPERLTVRELAGVRHSLAQIAYLSACSTAENSSLDLANEVIHIASAFQLLGFPHVIGTLWEADNQCATEVAGAFYRNLIQQLRESGSDVSHDVVAFALHHATRKLRQKKPGNVIGWAPFIHIGA
ncbi:hypothetical protein ETB97_005199 [Aspergillus alliaceus]|uniref:CHAT domain-containing protein n=1 Tax=Petromyces alliaceus TaxID=209559 RepID=A0A8H6A0W7_PETAA|nr:hypothetical protein ETB97_005199 [Aspergillus burnettii]